MSDTVSDQDLTISYSVARTPAEVFAAVTDVRGWWSGEIDGPTDSLGAEFTYRYQDIHFSKQRITELVPGERVRWQVLDGYLGFTDDPAEWTGTEIVFDLSPHEEGTTVRFTHRGLGPSVECFETCSGAWAFYIGTSLRDRITSGTGRPNPAEG